MVWRPRMKRIEKKRCRKIVRTLIVLYCGLYSSSCYGFQHYSLVKMLSSNAINASGYTPRVQKLFEVVYDCGS